MLENIHFALYLSVTHISVDCALCRDSKRHWSHRKTECIDIGCAAVIPYIILGGLDVAQIFFMLNFESVLSYVHEWQTIMAVKITFALFSLLSQ